MSALRRAAVWLTLLLVVVPAGLPAALPLDLRDRPALGREDAPVVVVEISSFKCSHCRTFHAEVFPRLREQYIAAGKVRWVVLNASDENADQFAKIFAIARCAGRQGRYWDVLDDLFRVAHRAPSFLEDLLANNALLDRPALDLCLRDRSLRNVLADDFALYAALKVHGTPTFLIWKLGRDGTRTEATISGGQKLDYFQRVFDGLLSAP
jgi:protein-disulfide isomerase